jgi:hypothetical protein
VELPRAVRTGRQEEMSNSAVVAQKNTPGLRIGWQVKITTGWRQCRSGLRERTTIQGPLGTSFPKYQIAPEPFGQRLGGGLSMDAREKYRRRDRRQSPVCVRAIFGSGLF